MLIERAFLAFVILMLGGFGVAFLLRPEATAGLVGIQLASTAARSDVRAVYGGLEIGLALVLVYCALDPSRVGPGLWLVAILFGAVAGARLLGTVLDRPVQPLTWKVLAVEAATALLALLLALRTPSAGAS